MFRAIGRYIRAIGYLFTGRIDAARKILSKDPAVIQATYDRIVEEKTRTIGQYKDAVGKLVSQEEKKLSTVKRLTEDVTRLERLKEGAAAKAKMLVDKLKGRGLDLEAIKHDEEYIKCLAAFNDFTSSLTEKNDRIVEIETDMVQLRENISNHKVQLQSLLREIDKIKEESAATVADVLTAKEEEAIADMISGISVEDHARELQEMREMRSQAKATARVASELAGTDTKRQEAEFLDFARGQVATDEFDQLIGLAEEVDAPASAPSAQEKAPDVQTQLPEE